MLSARHKGQRLELIGCTHAYGVLKAHQGKAEFGTFLRQRYLL